MGANVLNIILAAGVMLGGRTDLENEIDLEKGSTLRKGQANGCQMMQKWPVQEPV